MASSDLEAARIAFRDAAIGYWSQVGRGDPQSADRHTDASDSIVLAWSARSRLTELLLPLLEEDSLEVRYAAASYLLGTPATAPAVAVLEILQEDPKGLIAPTARLRLMTWRRDRQSTSAG
jgi:hypothetical protein